MPFIPETDKLNIISSEVGETMGESLLETDEFSLRVLSLNRVYIPVNLLFVGKWEVESEEKRPCASSQAQLQCRSTTVLSHARIKVATSHSRRWFADYVSGCLYPRETLLSLCVRYREREYERIWRGIKHARARPRFLHRSGMRLARREYNLYPLNFEHDHARIHLVPFIQVIITYYRSGFPFVCSL